MAKETVQQKKIKNRLKRMWNMHIDRGREYYWVKQMQEEIYIGKPYSDKDSPRGNDRAESWAKSLSERDNTRMEIFWTTGPPGVQRARQLENWRLYKVYENGIEIE